MMDKDIKYYMTKYGEFTDRHRKVYGVINILLLILTFFMFFRQGMEYGRADMCLEMGQYYKSDGSCTTPSEKLKYDTMQNAQEMELMRYEPIQRNASV